MEETIHKHVTEHCDSIEIGTPSKGGALKIYHNFADPDGFNRKIDNAKTVRDYANTKLQLG